MILGRAMRLTNESWIPAECETEQLKSSQPSAPKSKHNHFFRFITNPRGSRYLGSAGGIVKNCWGIDGKRKKKFWVFFAPNKNQLECSSITAWLAMRCFYHNAWAMRAFRIGYNSDNFIYINGCRAAPRFIWLHSSCFRFGFVLLMPPLSTNFLIISLKSRIALKATDWIRLVDSCHNLQSLISVIPFYKRQLIVAQRHLDNITQQSTDFKIAFTYQYVIRCIAGESSRLFFVPSFFIWANERRNLRC